MFQKIRLQTRFTFFILLITLPLLTGSLYFLNSRASEQINEQANRALRDANNTIATDASTWLEQQYRALQQTANLPDVVSMDSVRQRNALIAMAQAHPNLYLVHTLDMSGFNIARNDDAELRDYSDRDYYKSVISGEPIAYQVVIGRTSGQPALVLAVPILDENSNIIGVVSSAGLLDDISQDVTDKALGESGIVFVVDAINQIIAHTNPAYTTGELQDFSTYPPVAALRQGQEGLITFTDENNVSWRAFVSQIDNGWGIVVQQTESELLAPTRAFHTFTLTITLVGLGFLIGFSTLTIRRIVTPIEIATETAKSIANGNFSQRIPVKSKDEIGQLGEAFNAMASQVQELVSELEKRVEERTAKLEERARQLQAVTEVARSAASVQELERLLSDSAHLISESFGFYHVGIFLLDENGGNVVLRAANSEGGGRMLARQHALPVDRNSIVGYTAQTQIPRIALDTGADAVYFDNPDLPETRSEMAVPLKIGARLIGVLDVQSTEKDAFSEDDIAIIGTLGDQLAVAMENTRLLDEARRALLTAEQTYQRFFNQAWSQFSMRQEQAGYAYHDGKILPLGKQSAKNDGNKYNNSALRIPLRVRGQEIGTLIVQSKNGRRDWSVNEIALLETAAERSALALENARLLEDAQRRAARERTISEMTTNIGLSTDMEIILRTAAMELGRQISGAKVAIELSTKTEQEGS